jgi:tripartite ATP-independent transporter DctM subunit
MTVAIVAVLMLVLVALGMWTGVALVLAGLVGLWLSFGDLALLQAGTIVWDLANSSTLVAIPLFILMGELLAGSRSARDLFNWISRFNRHVSSAPALGTVGVASLISAVSGSLAAVTAIVTRTTYARLRAEGLPARQSLGLVASTGALGIMIPPSLTLIIYGSLTETPISVLFRVSIIPGIIQAALFLVCAAILWHIYADRAKRAAAPADEASLSITAAWQFPVAVAIVIGGFISGLVTPIEAAALGALLALIMNVINGELSWSRITIASRSTIVSTAMILLIVLGAQMIASTLAFQGFTRAVSLWIPSLPILPTGIMLLIVLLYIVLGMLFDGLSMMVLTLPFIFPAVRALGYDPLWFGVVLVVCVQLAELSPPVGVNLFVAQHLTGEPIEEVWWGVLPYFAVLAAVLLALLAFPQLGLMLQ